MNAPIELGEFYNRPPTSGPTLGPTTRLEASHAKDYKSDKVSFNGTTVAGKVL
jgi:hypothetical protein